MEKAVREWYQQLSRKAAKARAESLSPERRKEIATQAANKRWEKAKKKK